MMKRDLPLTPQEAIERSEEYYNNAKEILKDVEIKFGIYTDGKKVREACAMGYLSALTAIDAYLLKRGKKPEELPTSFAEYREVVSKMPYNGKLTASLTAVYQNLHVLGYYRGGIEVEMIKSGFKHAKRIIDTIKKLV